MKYCSQCGNEFPSTVEYFHRDKATKDGLVWHCKSCQSEYARLWRAKNLEKSLENSRRYRGQNLEKRREYERQYQQQNREKILEYGRQYREKNRDKERERQRRWVEQNRERYREHKRQYCQQPRRRINGAVAAGIRNSLKGGKDGRHWESIVGYSLADLIAHLESQFKRGMSWSNYGSKWHIDHMRPVSDFTFTSYDDPEFLECWSLWNLQPLWSKENLSKGANCEEPPLPLLTKGGRRS